MPRWLLTFLLFLKVFIASVESFSKTNGYADPTLDVAFHKVFFAKNHTDLLVKLLNDMLEPAVNDRVFEIEELRFFHPVKIAGRFTSCDMRCKTMSGPIVVQFQMKHVLHYFPGEAINDAALKYAQETRGQRLSAPTVKMFMLSNTELIPNTYAPLSQHSMLPPRLKPFARQDIAMTIFEIPKCRVDKVSDIRSSTDLWCYFFARLATASRTEISSLEIKYPIMKKALAALNLANWTDSELKNYDNLMNEQLESARSHEDARKERENQLKELKSKWSDIMDKVVVVAQKNSTDKDTKINQMMKEIGEIKQNMTAIQQEDDNFKRMVEKERAANVTKT